MEPRRQIEALTDQRFEHSTPALYDRYMGQLLFEPYAKFVAERCALLQPRNILETACGTGIVTRALHRAVPGAELVATDINPAMLEFAEHRLSGDHVSFQQADAQNLPFVEASFDLVVNQFGVMFFPDRIRAGKEARRVLRPHGRYVLVTFNRLEFNPVPKAAADAVNALFANEPIDYMESGPFCYCDRARIKNDLSAAGFPDVEIETVELSSHVNARDAARGFVFGSPLRAEIERRGRSALDRAAEAVAQALTQLDGKDAPMSAHVVTAGNSVGVV